MDSSNFLCMGPVLPISTSQCDIAQPEDPAQLFWWKLENPNDSPGALLEKVKVCKVYH